MRKLLPILILLSLLCMTTVGENVLITSFNSGELSPLLEGRVDVARYYSGCSTLENMVVLPHGGVTKRPGSYYIADTKTHSKVCRLIPFEYSTEQAYIIEVGNLYMRFYKDGGQITNDDDSIYEVTTEYVEDDLFELQYVQSADMMYIVHPDYPPASLTRADHNDWTLSDITFERGPFLPENDGDTTITPSGTSDSITLTASAATFNANHVGALWQITHTVEASAVSDSFSSIGDSNSATITIQLGRGYNFTTHGKWIGTISLQRSYDDGSNWKDIVFLDSYEDGNISYADREDANDAIYRVFMDDLEASSTACFYTLTAHSHDIDGVVTITAFTSTTVVSATVTNPIGDTNAVTTWAEGAWSVDEGYPSCVAFYEERQAYAATTNSPQTIWLSQTDDWDNFLIGPDDTDAMALTIASDQVNTIRWLSPQSSLLIGTAGGEWSLSASGAGEPLTPTNVSAKRHSGYGSFIVQPQVINNSIFFLQRQAQKLRKFQYSWDSDTWKASDITLMSEHITGDGITQIAQQKNPYPILWCVREDGALVGVTLEENNDVIGWHRHEFGGDVESVAVIPGAEEDEVWTSIERTVKGGTFRYIEQLQPFDWGSSQRDAFFVDSGLSFDGGAPITITNITQADPAVVSAAAHGFSDGDQVRITDVIGMIEINNKVYTVDDAATNTFSLDDADEVGDINSVDFTTYTSDGSVEQVENTFSLAHLGTETIAVCGDGGYYGTETPSSTGVITLNDYYNTVHAGKAFTSKMGSMPLSSASNPKMTFSTNKVITEVVVRLFDTLGCDIGPSWISYDSLIFRKASDVLDAPPPLYTGDKSLLYRGGYETTGRIYVQNRYPLPFTLLAFKAELEVYP